jgi:carbon monoxide dehydrogenase subunit G
MDLTNEFVVAAPVDATWSILTDIERIAPCVPGFQLQEIEGSEYRGLMKVKLGAVVMSYASTVQFVEKDAETRRVVMKGGGRETKGQGNVSATIVSTLEPDGDRTKVTVATSLDVTGRVAGFGRGILADVSNRLVDQFVKCIEDKILAGERT